MRKFALSLIVLTIAVGLVAGCAQAPAPAPTQAPAAPAKATAPAKAAEPTKPAAAQPAPTAAAAQPTAVPAKKLDFPAKDKAITMIMPWPAGSVNDVLTRLFLDQMQKELGGQINVVNKPGAGSQVGITELAASKPDGYTIAFNAMPSLALVYLDPERKATFTAKELQPLAVMTQEPMALSVKSDSQYKSVKDLVDAAKASPGKIRVGDAGFMSFGQMTIIALGRETGSKIVSVHFNGDSEVTTAVLGGHVEAGITGTSTALANTKNGNFRVVALTGGQETSILPGVKPLTAQGYNVDSVLSRGYVGPAGMPKEIVDLYGNTFKKIAADPDFKKKAGDGGFMVNFLDPAGYAAQWQKMETAAAPLIDIAKKEQ